MRNLKFYENGYSYIKPLKKAAKVLLSPAYYKQFESSIQKAVLSKEFYFIDEEKHRYFVEYIPENDYDKLNKRYLKLALKKDIKILKRDGKKVLEYVEHNHVWYTLERYLFHFAIKHSFIVKIKRDALLTQLKKLADTYDLIFDGEVLNDIAKKIKDKNYKFKITHDIFDYSLDIWTQKDISLFLKVANYLEKEGYVLFAAQTRGNGGWMGLVKKREFAKFKKLLEIETVAIKELFTNYIGERYYTYDEEFEIFYNKIKEEILQNDCEIVYRVRPSATPSKSLSYFLGDSVGVDDESYPMFGDKPMEHFCTLDVNDFPHLQQEYKGTRAISLYISNLGDNEAYMEDTQETKVVFLSQDDIENKTLKNLAPTSNKKVSMQIDPYVIPKGLLNSPSLDNDQDSWQSQLYNYWHSSSYVGGGATFIQRYIDEDTSDGFIAQFGEYYYDTEVTVNFGGGVMYMFDNYAFWEC